MKTGASLHPGDSMTGNVAYLTVFYHYNRMVLCVPKSQVAELGIVRGTTDRGVHYYVEPHKIISAGDQLASIKNELASIEEKIEHNLTQTVLKASSVIDQGIHAMARLDVIFSKAAFGNLLNGAIPKVMYNGQIDVRDFVHPVLALRASIATDTTLSENAVPIDLLLSHEQDSSAALIISGPNGGGKTVALKSFGVASLLTKVAIPIPRSSSHSDGFGPRIDFFDNVLVQVGDQQNVFEGDSTLMARLNSFSTIIKSVTGEHNTSSSHEPSFFLVLMDELGAGTDPTAGGAIAQAVLEKLLESEKCRVVATTHSSRLKALSYNKTRFGCAAVLLRNDGSSDFKRPSYRLQYGLIGDSYALGAASRSSPPLPDDVLRRAASLMTSSSSTQEAENVDFLRALSESLEQETEAVLKIKVAMAVDREETHACRNAMVSLAVTYADHLNNVEDRLQHLFRNLRDDESKSAVNIVGETIESLKLVRKKLKTEAEKLRERGLQLVPSNYKLTQGESVVIIADNEWRGTSATVVEPHPEVENAVLVIPSIPTWNDALFQSNGNFLDDASTTTEPLIMKRSELAVWDMDSVWDDSNKAESPIMSVRESRQKLSTLLSTLTTSTNDDGSTKPRPQKNPFKSARQRKAAKSMRKKK
jgi:DNA mismatch repair protein MutS2